MNAVDVLVHGQWQKLRSAAAEALRATVERGQTTQRVARTIAPWLTKTPPLVLLFVHILFIAGVSRASRGAAADSSSSRLRVLMAALIGAAIGLLFGFFEQLGSGWWRNDSLFPSFAREEWWLAKFTAAAAGAFLGARLARRDARPRLWRFIAASALVPVLIALSVAGGWTLLKGTSGALLVGFFAFGSGLVSSRQDSEDES